MWAGTDVLADEFPGDEPGVIHAASEFAAGDPGRAALPERRQFAISTTIASAMKAANPHRTRRERGGRIGPGPIRMVGEEPGPPSEPLERRGGGREEIGGGGGIDCGRLPSSGPSHDMGRGARNENGSPGSTPPGLALGAGRSVTAEGEWRVAIAIQCHSLGSLEGALNQKYFVRARALGRHRNPVTT